MRRCLRVQFHAGAGVSAFIFVATLFLSVTDNSTYRAQVRWNSIPSDAVNVPKFHYDRRVTYQVRLPAGTYGIGYIWCFDVRWRTSLVRVGSSVLPLVWVGYMLRVVEWPGAIRRRMRERRRRGAHLCRRCGYDLRATGEAVGPRLAQCPECGTASGGGVIAEVPRGLKGSKGVSGMVVGE